MPETDRRMILDRDRRNMGSNVVVALNSDFLNKIQFSCDENDLINGQTLQLTRRLLRIGMIAKLGDEDLLYDIFIDEIFGRSS
jgi:hypothetical protein